jgi:cellulose biosynthesis protein BcsQ
LGLSVVVADLDSQANLTSMFLEEEELESLWNLMPMLNLLVMILIALPS